jgi:predicted nucleic acid-binding protein
MTEQFLFDSNVHVDILADDPVWFDWSSGIVTACSKLGTLAINPIIYAEVAARFETITELDDALIAFERFDLPWDAAFLASKAFTTYRLRGGAKRSPLPDFYIGAHALVSHLTLVTRDATRYRTYFPALKIIAPN